MSLEKVRVLKQESAALGGDAADAVEYPDPINPTEDVVEAAAFYLQEGGIDDAVTLKRVSGHMAYSDAKVPHTRKLVDQLLEGETVSSAGTSTAYTTTSGDVVEELVSVGATPLRRITYTYSSGDVSTEVVKVYASDGTTVIGQVTRTYSYASDPPSVTSTRDV